VVKDLNELVTKLKVAAGANLKSVVLYGSAATGEFHPKHSDLNVLCILERVDGSALEQLNPATVWWARKGHPAPLVFSAEELRSAADVFSIEFADIKVGHKVLFGDDLFKSLEVPMRLHREQVERELRNNLVRLRQHYLAAPGDDKALLELMTESVSSFTTLFRHALIALGDSAPHRPLPQKQDALWGQPQSGELKRRAVDRLASLFGFDPSGFHTVFDVREGKQPRNLIDVRSTFRAYLEAVTRVTQAVDQKLGELSNSSAAGPLSEPGA